jgi:nucleotide-binding universal stress UspA family protein
MVPVDLAHAGSLDRALTCAADLAHQHDAQVIYVGVTAALPSSVAHTPAEYKTKLEKFAAKEAEIREVKGSALVLDSHDPAVEIDKTLLRAVSDTGADLVVMQSHTPGIADYIFEGHGPFLAQHAKASVLLVRG